MSDNAYGGAPVPQDPMAAGQTPEPAMIAGRIEPKSISTMIQTVQRLENSIKERRDVDRSLINWWLFILLVGPITFGIYSIVRMFCIINRVDKFIIRKQSYYHAVIEFTGRYAMENGKMEIVKGRLQDLGEYADFHFGRQLKTIKAWPSFFFTIITLGIYGLVVWYRLNRIWNDLQIVEQEFDDKLSIIWQELGLTKYPLSFRTDPSKKRSFLLYFVLSIVTLGIWGLVWDYKIHNDPDNLYSEFHSLEDAVLQTARQVA